MKPALVVGAGLSGLATAWCLAERGFDVTIVESASRSGGLIHTRTTPFGPAETAANAFVWSETVSSWFRQLDLTPVFARPASANRYIFRDGRARRWPLTARESAGVMARAGKTALLRGFAAREGESVAGWGYRVVGPAATRWLLEPAMQGIYAAPADRLSARAIFAGRRSRRPRSAAPPGGMGEFITRLETRLASRGVRFQFETIVETIDPDRPTAVCCGAPAAARLLQSHVPDVAAEVARISTSGLTTATAFFAPDPSDLRGFGVLFPAGAGVQALGVLFNTDIFDGRGNFRSETWIYGNREQATDTFSDVTNWDEFRLAGVIEADRQTLTGRRAQPLHVAVTRWPEAVPVYDEAVLRAQAAARRLPPWLALSGNYLGAIGVSRLFDAAEAAALRLAGGARVSGSS